MSDVKIEGKAKRFRIQVQFSETLDVLALWPDGDAPENPTVEDVLALIENEGGFLAAVREWGLDEGGENSVEEVDEHGKQIAICYESAY